MKRRKKRRLWRKRWFLLGLVLLIIILVNHFKWIERLMYPIEYRETIYRAAEQYGVDPLLIGAIIRVESNFRPHLESAKGAIGIMQLMPATAEELLQRSEFKGYTRQDLTDPELNIRLGTLYIRQLSEWFDHNLPVTIASYNAGPGNVRGWLNSGIWDGRAETAEKIPFRETRNYVKKVLYYYDKYQSIYGST